MDSDKARSQTGSEDKQWTSEYLSGSQNDDFPHSTDVWSTARALTVLRESLFSDNPVTSKALEDATRYLGEFGEIRSKAEFQYRLDHDNVARERALTEGRRSILNTEVFREGERVIREREARKLRTETRKTSKKVKHG